MEGKKVKIQRVYIIAPSAVLCKAAIHEEEYYEQLEVKKLGTQRDIEVKKLGEQRLFYLLAIFVQLEYSSFYLKALTPSHRL